MMKTTRMLLVAASLAVLGAATPAFAQDHATPPPPRQSWSFGGVFGAFDRAQLQRGFKIYREVCQNCHALQIPFRTLAQNGGPEFSTGQVQALAAEYKVKDGPNDAGDMFERPGRPADVIPPPFPNENAAAAANGGKAPPALQLVAKARSYERGFPWFVFDALPFLQYQEHGPDYIHAILTGYTEAPHGVTVPPGGNYNEYFPGHVIAMPKPLNDGQVEFPKAADGKAQVPETVDQYARDISAFLMWAAEPTLEQRKRTGMVVICFLLLFSFLLSYAKKKVWARVGGEAEGSTAQAPLGPTG